MRSECRNCMFWKPSESLSRTDGFCHRYPPVLFSKYARDWDEVCRPDAWAEPVTDGSSWCGEFKRPRVSEDDATEEILIDVTNLSSTEPEFIKARRVKGSVD